MKTSKSKRTQHFQKVVEALGQYYEANSTLVVNGVERKAAEVAREFHDTLKAIGDTEAARAEWHDRVNQERAAVAKGEALSSSLRSLVSGTFGEDSKQLVAFGFTPKRQGRKSAETKAAAVEKALATRAARHTMGKRQREQVKGSVPSSQSNGTSAPTTSSNGAATF